MGLEKSFNEEGQEQRIKSFDKVIKIGDKFLQVRLIETRKFDRGQNQKEFCKPMPRAKFINPLENPYYLVRRDDVIKMKGGQNDRKIK